MKVCLNQEAQDTQAVYNTTPHHPFVKPERNIMQKFKNTVIRSTTAIFLTIASLSVQAKPLMTITCAEPNGTRTDFYAGEFKEDKDGFAGVTLKILFDSKKAQQATVLYEPANIAKEIGIKNPSTLFKIVAQNTHKISMIGQPNPDGVHLYTLYPKLGIGYFSIQRYNDVRGGEASTAALIGKCTVAAQ